jgi:hypothetical protein
MLVLEVVIHHYRYLTRYSAEERWLGYAKRPGYRSGSTNVIFHPQLFDT